MHTPSEPTPYRLPPDRLIPPPVAVTFSGESGHEFEVAEVPNPDYAADLSSHPTIWVIVHHGGLEIPFDEVTQRYIRRLRLGSQIRADVFDMGMVPDPAIDPEGFRRALWYQPDAILTLDDIRYMEAHRFLSRYPHGAYPGPLLGPSQPGPVGIPQPRRSALP